MTAPDPAIVESYRFRPEDLAPERRTAGISGFMRIKNGADFIEPTIRSHIPVLDELVAVHSGSTDGTPAVLARLAAEFAPKLRVYHYAPEVFPPGSAGHAAEPADSPKSFVNASNFALTRTRHRIVVKIDDDHLAMQGRLTAMADGIRRAACRLDHVLCFSGLNLARDGEGRLGILALEPFSGGGDIGFFEVTPRTRFIHDPRFETFDHGGRRRVFGDFTYWHLKFLKSGLGFANYDIEAGTNPRFARKRDRFLANRAVIGFEDFRRTVPKLLPLLAALPLPQRQRFLVDRWRAVAAGGLGGAEFAADCRAAGMAALE